MYWRDLIDVAVVYAERSTYMLIALFAILIPLYGLWNEPWILLLPLQITSVFFITLVAYSYLKRLLEESSSSKRGLIILFPSYSTLLSVLVPLLNNIPVISSAIMSAVLCIILCLKLYSELREYDVIMRP